MSEITISHKFCYKCDTLKHLSEFYKSKARYNRHNVTSQCKKCLHQINLKYRRTHRNKIKQQNIKYYQKRQEKKLHDKLLKNMSCVDTLNYIENSKSWTHADCLIFLNAHQRPVINTYHEVIKIIES